LHEKIPINISFKFFRICFEYLSNDLLLKKINKMKSLFFRFWPEGPSHARGPCSQPAKARTRAALARSSRRVIGRPDSGPRSQPARSDSPKREAAHVLERQANQALTWAWAENSRARLGSIRPSLPAADLSRSVFIQRPCAEIGSNKNQHSSSPKP
jgi:hypothetical protein